MKPIYSSHCDDPSAGEAVDRFVIRLAERIDQLQDAEADLAGLAPLAAGLRAESDAAGYAALAGAAEVLEIACNDGDSKLVHEKLIGLTEIAQRVRLGHKGAV
jgi:hypothetical protein